MPLPRRSAQSLRPVPLSFSRRNLLVLAIGAASSSVFSAGSAFSQRKCDRGIELEQRNFQNGDLLFPKIRGQWIVRYGQGEKDQERVEFVRQRDELIRQMEREPEPSIQDRNILKFLLSLHDYSAFERGFEAGEWPGDVVERSKGGSPVGHVAVLEKNGPHWSVIEAMPGDGVRRVPYPVWRDNERTCQLVWLARLSGVDQALVDEMVHQVALLIGKPYGLFNRRSFDLDNSERFYCSKLVWYAYWRATTLTAMQGKGLDGNNATKRDRFVSPLDLLKKGKLSLVVDQGNFRFR